MHVDGVNISKDEVHPNFQRTKRQITVKELKEHLESFNEDASIEIVIEDRFDRNTRNLDSIEEFKSVDRHGHLINRLYLKG